MKTIKILSVAFILMSFQCTPDEIEKETQCDCVTTYYTLPIGSQSFQWYSTGDTNDINLDCEDETNGIIPVGGASTMFYKVECE